jgi:hypothetical protein
MYYTVLCTVLYVFKLCFSVDNVPFIIRYAPNSPLTPTPSLLPRALLCRRDDELGVLQGTREGLQESLRRLDGDAAKVREMLRAEQAALTAAQRERREHGRQLRRQLDESKGEGERRERELRKRVADLTRGAHAGDKVSECSA